MGKPVIGFIGVGYMGHGMAKNILQNGYDLYVKGHRNRTPVENLVGMGAKECGSPRKIAGLCDIIHICVSNAPQVEAIFRGEDGILAGAREGLIVIDASTSDPNVTLALADELAAKGGAMVDAPLGRTPKEAEAGTLDVMVGSDPETYEKVLPVIQCWGGAINHVGPVGSGHKMKLIMNFISMGMASLYAEAVVLGAKVGVPPATVRNVIGASRLNNGFFETFMKYTVDRDRNAHLFTIANATKDLNYVNAMAAEAGVVNIVAGAVRQYFTHAGAVGGAGDFVPMIGDYVGRMNGIDMEAEAKKGR